MVAAVHRVLALATIAAGANATKAPNAAAAVHGARTKLKFAARIASSCTANVAVAARDTTGPNMRRETARMRPPRLRPRAVPRPSRRPRPRRTRGPPARRRPRPRQAQRRGPEADVPCDRWHGQEPASDRRPADDGRRVHDRDGVRARPPTAPRPPSRGRGVAALSRSAARRAVVPPRRSNTQLIGPSSSYDDSRR